MPDDTGRTHVENTVEEVNFPAVAQALTWPKQMLTINGPSTDWNGKLSQARPIGVSEHGKRHSFVLPNVQNLMFHHCPIIFP